MKPKVIQNAEEHAQALRRIDELIEAEPGTPEGDDLDLWITLVELYEATNEPIEPPSAGDAIRFRMEQLGLRQTDLAPLLGSRSRVSEVLSGKRHLALTMIRSLHHELGIPLASLVASPAAAGVASPSRARGISVRWRGIDNFQFYLPDNPDSGGTKARDLAREKPLKPRTQGTWVAHHGWCTSYSSMKPASPLSVQGANAH
jgi:antitoxin component HigA of HigAB toxin-antitoxin module